jgi:hypothetical protein
MVMLGLCGLALSVIKLLAPIRVSSSAKSSLLLRFEHYNKL